MKKYKNLIIGFVIFLLVTGLNLVNAYITNPNKITIREERIYSSKIDKNANGMTIAYFADLHYGTLVNEDKLNTLIDALNSVGPDVVIFGGDLVDSSVKLNKEISNILIDNLSKLTYRFGKYAVLGDEDQANKDLLKEIYLESGFELLENGNRKLYLNNSLPVNLVGIDSIYYGKPDIATSFNSIDSSYFTLVVTHCPDLYLNLKNNYGDYILSAHSLGGPVNFPVFNLIDRPEGAKSFFSGKHRDDKNTLDITNGVGLKDSKTRFFADSEVVFYKLYSK